MTNMISGYKPQNNPKGFIFGSFSKFFNKIKPSLFKNSQIHVNSPIISGTTRSIRETTPDDKYIDNIDALSEDVAGVITSHLNLGELDSLCESKCFEKLIDKKRLNEVKMLTKEVRDTFRQLPMISNKNYLSLGVAVIQSGFNEKGHKLLAILFDELLLKINSRTKEGSHSRKYDLIDLKLSYVSALMEVDSVEKALSVTSTLEENYDKVRSYKFIVKSLALKGDFDKAIEVMKNIETSDETYFNELCFIGECYLNNNMPAKADKYLESAFNQAVKFGFKEDSAQSVIQRIAKLQAKAGFFDKALSSSEKVVDLHLDSLRIDRCDVYSYIAEQAIAKDKVDVARESFKRAEDFAVSKFNTIWDNDNPLCKIALKMAEMGFTHSAHQTFQKIRAIHEQLDIHDERRSITLRNRESKIGLKNIYYLISPSCQDCCRILTTMIGDRNGEKILARV